jgi:hypothetical protein
LSITNPLIEEYIAELTRAVGDAYMAVQDGVGDEATPGTALFEVAQLRDLTQRGLPRFGVLTTSPPSFAVTVVGSSAFVSAGTVGYQGQRLVIPPQGVSLSYAFGPYYSSSAQYGVRLGFPMSEALKDTLRYSSVVSALASTGSSVVQIADISIAEGLGFPLSAYVGSSFVVFSGLDQTGTMLQVDGGFNGGVVPTSFAVGSPVNFLYSPRVLAVYGLPVETSVYAGTASADFPYYPPMPPDWLPVANILMTNPAAPVVATSGGQPSITSTLAPWPAPESATPIFSATDAPTIIRVCDATSAALSRVRQTGGVSDMIGALEQYTAAVSDVTQTSFRAFWGARPFRASSYFGRGVSFEGLERLEFSDSFANAYYATSGDDVQHTMAIFRGDLYGMSGSSSGGVSGVTVTPMLAGPVPSSLTRGTYVYGVSVVTSAGETPPTYGTGFASAASSATFINEVSYPVSPGSIFFHVYRRSSIGGDQTEYRLTADNQIRGSGLFAATAVSPNTDEALDHAYEAFNLVASSGTQIGGVAIKLKMTSASVTNTSDSVTVSLCADASGSPGAPIVTGTPIPYSALTTSYQTVVSQFDATLTFGSAYWIVLGRTAAPSTGSVELYTQSTGTALYAESPDDSVWTAKASRTAWCQPLNFLDNGRAGLYLTRRGVKLTGKTALVPRQLSVYVPLLDPTGLSVGYEPPFSDTGAVSAVEPTEILNDLVVTVIARNGASGVPVTLTATVPKGTPRDTRFLLGASTQLFDRVDDVQVRPGSSLTLVGSQIQWSLYDTITVETAP